MYSNDTALYITNAELLLFTRAMIFNFMFE